jgi:transcriptional regulator
MSVLNRKQKEKYAKKLLEEGKSWKEIAKIAHLSLRDIGKIDRKLKGKTESKSKSTRSRAYAMFSKDKEPIQVAIDLDISYIEVTQYYKEYLSLKHMDDFVRTCKDYPDLLPFLTEIAKKMIMKELFKIDIDFLINGLGDVKIVFDYKDKLHMRSIY